MESRQGSDLQPAQTVPAWDSLAPLDMQRRWILKISTHIIQDNKPDEIRAAQDRLMSIRNELEGIFDFKVVDRKVHDTRVSQQQQPMPVLPRKVTIGQG